MSNKEDIQEGLQPARPLCLELVDAKNDIFEAINNASKQRNIPYFLLESIVTEAALQVSNLAKIEREAAAKKYEQQIIGE